MKPRAAIIGTLLAAAPIRVVHATEPASAPPSGGSDVGRVSLGARVGLQSIFLEGDGSPSDLSGGFAGVDITLRLSRSLSLASVAEGSFYDGRSDRLPGGPSATSLAAFGELRIDTNPDGPLSARIDIGPGYRWLWVPLSSGTTDGYGGIEPLRLRMGPAYRFGDIQVSATFGIAFGWFTGHAGDHSCAVTGTCQDSILDSDFVNPVHFVGDLSIAVRAWP